MFGVAPIGSLPIGATPSYVALVALVSARFLILSPADSDAAVMAAGSQVATLPVANLQDYQPKKVWRSGGTTDYVTAVFAAPVAANMLALVGHNLSAAGVIRVRGAASLAGTTSSPPVDTGWVSAWPNTGKPTSANWASYLSPVLWANDAEYQYWRVDIADPSAARSFIQAGRLMIGRYWQPSINFDLGGTPLGFDQQDVQVATDYGQTFTDRRTRSAPRLFALTMSAGDKREVLDGIAEIQRLRGMWGDVVCLLDPNATTDLHRHSMQGVFKTPQQHSIVQQFTAAGEMWTVTLNLREVI